MNQNNNGEDGNREVYILEVGLAELEGGLDTVSKEKLNIKDES